MAADRRHMRALGLGLALVLAATAGAGAMERNAPIEDFFGTYVGNARIEDLGRSQCRGVFFQ